MLRRTLCRVVVSLAVAGVATVGVPTAVGAEPATPTYCSSWKQWEEFRHRACITYELGTVMGHTTQVQNLGPTLTGVPLGSKWHINGSSGTCVAYEVRAFNPGQTRSFTCHTTKVSGWAYKTTSNVNNASSITSPIGRPA